MLDFVENVTVLVLVLQYVLAVLTKQWTRIYMILTLLSQQGLDSLDYCGIYIDVVDLICLSCFVSIPGVDGLSRNLKHLLQLMLLHNTLQLQNGVYRTLVDVQFHMVKECNTHQCFQSSSAYLCPSSAVCCLQTFVQSVQCTVTVCILMSQFMN